MMSFRSRQRAGRTAAALAAACCILGVISSACLAQTWPPKGEPVRLPVTRDNWMSSAGGETKGNNGGANKFKLKGRQEYAISDVDVGGLKGKIVTGAMFHFHTTTPNAPALRVTVSSVATPWVEGAATPWVEGAACPSWATSAWPRRCRPANPNKGSETADRDERRRQCGEWNELARMRVLPVA